MRYDGGHTSRATARRWIDTDMLAPTTGSSLASCTTVSAMMARGLRIHRRGQHQRWRCRERS